MWALCDRKLTAVLEFGPELTGSRLSMELSEPIGIVDILNGMALWLVKPTRSARKSGVILNPEAPEVLATMGTVLMYQAACDWGAWKARTMAEVAFYAAPACRRGPEKLG